MTLDMPAGAIALVEQITKDPELNYGVRVMKARATDFKSRDHAVMAGIAVMPQTRRMLDEQLDKEWSENLLPTAVGELVVGGGLHAAAYCTARVRQGFSLPLVVEQDRVGGIFAATRSSAWWLNSRNRPGPLGNPGDGAALNMIPGAMLQPCDLSGDEFQRNDDLAFCIRMALAQSAHVVTGARVDEVEDVGAGCLNVKFSDGREVLTSRLIEARGLGRESITSADSKRCLSFTDFMTRITEDPFPLRGVKRVAVLGGGDSGKCAIEALIGQGPAGHMSTAGLDYIERIDWYGQRLPTNCVNARVAFRSRYNRVAGAFPNGNSTRVRPIQSRGNISPGFDCIYVNDQPYDLVIACVGWFPVRFSLGPYENYDLGDRTLGRESERFDAFRIGAMAAPPIADQEPPAVRSLPENRIAAFRLVPRTAALAAALPATSLPVRPRKTNMQPIQPGTKISFQPGEVVSFRSGEVVSPITLKEAENSLNTFSQKYAVTSLDGLPSTD